MTVTCGAGAPRRLARAERVPHSSPRQAYDPAVGRRRLSRKMVARLQAATSPGLPVLLRTTSSTGHIGTPLDERIAEDADVYAFLFHELGVTYAPVAPAKPGM